MREIDDDEFTDEEWSQMAKGVHVFIKKAVETCVEAGKEYKYTCQSRVD